MGDSAGSFFIGMDLGEGDAGGVIDADVDVFPAISLAFRARVGLSGPIARDAMAVLSEAVEFLDVEVDHPAGSGVFIASRRRWRVEIAGAGETSGAQDAADSRGKSPVSRAISQPGRRSRRRSIRLTQTAFGVGL